MPGRIPEKFIDELMTRVDIVDVIDRRVPLKKAGKDYKACCPFHEEKTPSFTVSQDKQFYHCFGCGAHGTAIGFLMQYEHLSFPEAVEDLAAAVGLSIPHEAQAQAPQAGNTQELLTVLQEADRFYRRQLREHPQAHAAVEYLKSRGLSGEIAAGFGLGYAPEGWDHLLQALGADAGACQALERAGLVVKKDTGGYYDRFRNRVMFPIHDYRGRVVGFGGRVLGAGEPKYLNSPETPVFHKGREIYGLFRAREAIRREQRVVVVEGYMDVVALAQFGIDYSVATLGTATTRDHLERIFRFAPEVIFCFDGDRAGREAAWRALEQALPVLHEGRQVGFLFLPEGEDPDSLVRREGRETFERRLQQAVPLPDYLFRTLAEQVDLGRLDGRARLVELARPLLTRLPSGVLRQMMLDRLSEISQVSTEKLSKLLINATKTPLKSSQNRPQAGLRPPSLVRQAIALLLQHPGLAKDVTQAESLRELDMPGVPLLMGLLDMLREQRVAANMASILERFRGSEHQHSLEKLAAWDYPGRQPDVESEFRGAMAGLYRAWIRQRTEGLLRKQRLQGLDTEEKKELQDLLAEKHGAGKE